MFVKTVKKEKKSRAPLHRSLRKDEKQLNEDINLYVSHIVERLPTTEWRLQEIRLRQDGRLLLAIL